MRGTTTGRPARWLLLGLLAAVIGGILAMHALTLTGSAAAGGHAAHLAAAGSPDHADHALQDGSEALAGPAQPGLTAARLAPASPPDLGDAVMLCVAMLAATALLLLGLLVALRGRAGPVAALLPRPGGSAARVPTLVRATGPPAAWRFSVVRC